MVVGVKKAGIEEKIGGIWVNPECRYQGRYCRWRRWENEGIRIRCMSSYVCEERCKEKHQSTFGAETKKEKQRGHGPLYTICTN